MEILFNQIDGINVSKITGRIDSVTSGDLQNAMMDYISGKINNFAVDFSEVGYISSAGLRTLLLVAKEMQKKNSSFAIFKMQDNIKDVFDLSGFSSIMNILPDFDSVKAKFKQ